MIFYFFFLPAHRIARLCCTQIPETSLYALPDSSSTTYTRGTFYENNKLFISDSITTSNRPDFTAIIFGFRDAAF